jgi:hypothetical protein
MLVWEIVFPSLMTAFSDHWYAFVQSFTVANGVLDHGRCPSPHVASLLLCMSADGVVANLVCVPFHSKVDLLPSDPFS